MQSGHIRSDRSLINLDSRFAAVGLIALVAALSYLAAGLGGALVLRPEMVWPLWPGCALVASVLLLVPRRIWPLLIAAGLSGFALYDWQVGLSLRATAFLLLADGVEILIAALGVSYSFGGVPQLDSTRSLARYSCFAVFLAPFWAAFVATAAFGGIDWIRWRIGFFTEALAFLTVTPAVLSCVHIARKWTRESPAFYLEAVALNAALVLLGYLAFVARGTVSPFVLLYSLLPLLLWSALRFGLVGISSSMIVVAFLSIWGAVRGLGPFTGSAPLRNMLSLQLFLFFASGTFMTLAVLGEQRKRMEEALRLKETELHEAQRIAQVGSWQWDPDQDAVDWSPELYRIAGRDPSLPAVTYAEQSHLYTPESWERLRSAVEQALENAVPYHLDLQMLQPDGTTRWVTARGEPRLDPLGRVVQLRGTLHDITEQKRTEEALSSLGSRLIQAQEHERTRIARELHDDIGQRLAMLVVELEHLRQDAAGFSPELANHIAELWRQTSGIAADTQTLSHELHSSKLELLGIVPAMRIFCKEFSEQQKVEIDFETNDISESVPPDVSLCLFRVLQEALHNSAKHSGVRHFEAHLWRTSGALHLTIGDSGAGFDYEAARKGRGLGLISMQERVKLVKGVLSVESHPNRGTRIHACIPLSAPGDSLEAAG